MVSPLPRAITQLPSCPCTFVCGQVGGGAGEDLEKGITLKNHPMKTREAVGRREVAPGPGPSWMSPSPSDEIPVCSCLNSAPMDHSFAGSPEARGSAGTQHTGP